jgi:hypothetical protein
VRTDNFKQDVLSSYKTLGRRTATTAPCSMTYEPSVIVIGSALAEPACPREIQRILIEGVAIE